MKLYLNSFWRSRYFICGAVLLLLGSGPLLVVGILDGFGLINAPNPVACGMLAGITFWPSVFLMLFGFAKAVGRRS